MSSNLIGRTLLNQFRVEAFIAAGGMGAVYRVWDLQRNVPLAMKVLHADLADDPSVFKLFQREANALKKLTHPNIVPFYGIHQSDDLVFLLQHFVDGYSLKEILRQCKGRPLPVEDVLVYLKALSAALGYAHVHNVVHCDVKPGNVMIDRGGNIYLTDFGIARHAESTTTTLGAAGAPAYMAPEQIRAEAVTPATDVYAMGVMLFEMLTGRRPFKGDEDRTAHAGATTGERIRIAHLTLSPPDPRRFNPSLPPALSQVIKKALAKEPSQRFPSMGGLLEAACAALGTNPGQLPSRIVPTGMLGKTPGPPSDGPEVQPEAGSLPIGTSVSSSAAIPQAQPRFSGTSLALILGGILAATILAFLGITRGCSIIPLTGSSPPTPVETTAVVPGITLSPQVPTETVILTDTPTKAPSPTHTPTETPSPTHTPTKTPSPTITPTKTPSPTHTPTITVTKAKSPDVQVEQFIRSYYENINLRNYDKTWSMLSETFQQEKSPDGFASYITHWNNYSRIEVLSAEVFLIQPEVNYANATVDLRYFETDGNYFDYLVDYYFTLNEEKLSWQFDLIAVIDFPENGAQVPRSVFVRGKIFHLMPNERAFLCVKSVSYGRIYPQEPIVPDVNGEWEVESIYQSPGYDYETFVVLTNNDESAEMLGDQYYRANGMEILPPDTQIVSPTLVVTRE